MLRIGISVSFWYFGFVLISLSTVNMMNPWPKIPGGRFKAVKTGCIPSGSPLGEGLEQVKSSCRQYPGGRFKTVYKGSIKEDSFLEIGSET